MSSSSSPTSVSLSEILSATQTLFPELAGIPFTMEPLQKGGSDRTFYRLAPQGKAPLIFVQYGSQREENRHYVQIAEFLSRAGVRVPRMWHHAPESGRIWMEDLGSLDLWSFRNESWEIRKPLYESVLLEALHLHTLLHTHPDLSLEPLGLQPSFDHRLYLWEQEYFFQNCLQRHFGWSLSRIAPLRAPLDALAHSLAALPRVLVHRDFQSQNIMIQEGRPCLIDFQGMRLGLPQYDLASLLLDPYVHLAPSEQSHLLAFYLEALRLKGFHTPSSFHQIFASCALQRLMQALGAYGFLGHEKGRADFLAHIPAALSRLRATLPLLPELQEMEAMLQELP